MEIKIYLGGGGGELLRRQYLQEETESQHYMHSYEIDGPYLYFSLYFFQKRWFTVGGDHPGSIIRVGGTRSLDGHKIHWNTNKVRRVVVF